MESAMSEPMYEETSGVGCRAHGRAMSLPAGAPSSAGEADQSMALLEVEGLRTVFHHRGGQVPVIDDVSITVSEGESFGVVGEPGRGMTMLGLSFIRLLPPGDSVAGGIVRWAGRDLLSLPESALNSIRGREIGTIFQDPVSSLNPTRTVGSQLVEVLVRHSLGSRRQAAARAVELLGEVQ